MSGFSVTTMIHSGKLDGPSSKSGRSWPAKNTTQLAEKQSRTKRLAQIQQILVNGRRAIYFSGMDGEDKIHPST
eukprot:scaffold18819_cov268-Amphora_coffeaeformis.AAC.3